ncbi:MAG: nitrous oxide reductase accessory protein NosL [Marinobacter adhaerens]|uniref:Nitrous oxide reductase accessory protein NosL n=1 Tax=Marinobacter adhaerens TaxID=1033846 RepID=A0A844I6N0_9GAMM|nr:nitrous oxide reductase accessory protein NosL [Marinobacter adhaerens]|tara:strand:+ start:914 stop:1450 length:537 start_codon:yes stop_codon:yes gene_type:complete
MNRSKPNWLLVALAAFALTACSGSEEQTTAKAAPVNFATGDECHVCGMVITNFPGPKGQAITEKDQHVRKFCSTRDMFAWALQPENVNRNHALYVHDMAETEWASPDDTALIDAREAFYVVGSNRKGAMGPTLASFAAKAEAEKFAMEYGGETMAFPEITMDHLNSGMAMHSMDGMDH